MAAVFRAIFGYLFLVFMVRVVGRRPGKQMAPFDYVLIFFIGGLTLTGMVANDRSLTNAFVQIITVALCHFAVTQLRRRSNRFAVWMDGTPLVLLRNGEWVDETIRKMNFSRDDILAAMRSIVRSRFPRVSAWVDGIPLILLREGEWQLEQMDGLRVDRDDVIAAAREKGLTSVREVEYAVVERNGSISIVPRR